MSWSFPIGRLFGSEIRVHVTFLLLLLWIMRLYPTGAVIQRSPAG